MNVKQKTLRLVTEPSNAQTVTGECSACDLKRQLEHVRMLLTAAQLAAAPKPEKPKGKR